MPRKPTRAWQECPTVLESLLGGGLTRPCGGFPCQSVDQDDQTHKCDDSDGYPGTSQLGDVESQSERPPTTAQPMYFRHFCGLMESPLTQLSG